MISSNALSIAALSKYDGGSLNNRDKYFVLITAVKIGLKVTKDFVPSVANCDFKIIDHIHFLEPLLD